MAYTQADADALKDAIATGAKSVKFGSGPDSREVVYRSLAEMQAALSMIVQEVSPIGFSPVSYVEHTRD